MDFEIIPAILVENQEEFVERIKQCEDFAETVQWDVMDGQFVDHMTFSDISALQDVDTVLNIEAHLMVDHPEELLADLERAGIDRVVAHAESADNLESLVSKMKEHDFEVAVAINPETPISVLEPVAAQLDEVLVMTVVPGSAGQSFLPSQLDKIKALRKQYPRLNIAVDGGVNAANIVLAKEAGANRFAANSSIFNAPDPVSAFEQLQSLVA